MAIQRFFTKSINIKRLCTLSGYRKNFQSTATVEGHIQELDRSAREKLGIIEQRAWISWFEPDCIIQEGDIVVDEYGTEYRVTEVTLKDYGCNTHKQCLMVEPNE